MPKVKDPFNVKDKQKEVVREFICLGSQGFGMSKMVEIYWKK